MYENKFENPEWERQQDTGYGYYVTNEQGMVEEISLRPDSDMDEEGLYILLRKYYAFAEKYGHTLPYRITDDIWLNMDAAEKNLHMVYKISYEKLSDFFNITDNQKRFAKEFIKYLELKYLLTARDFDITSKKSSKPFSYDDYGDYSKKVKMEVLDHLDSIGNPVDYVSVKNGTYKYAPKSDEINTIEESKKTSRSINGSNYKDTKTSSTKRFWKDWGLIKKILYIILNLYTFCIPLIFHIIHSFAKKKFDKQP